MCLAGVMCLPIIIVGVIITQAKNAVTGGRSSRIGWGPFRGFGGGGHHRGGSTRRHTPTRRGGGGGSRSGGRGRSGGGGRRR